MDMMKDILGSVFFAGSVIIGLFVIVLLLTILIAPNADHYHVMRKDDLVEHHFLMVVSQNTGKRMTLQVERSIHDRYNVGDKIPLRVTLEEPDYLLEEHINADTVESTK